MAQGVYTVSTEPAKGREYTNKHGTDLTVWRLGLDNAESVAPDGLFELHKKKAPPQVGEQIEVEKTIEGEFDGVKFTRLFLVDTYQKPSGGGSSSGGGGQGDGPGLEWKSAPFEKGAEHPRNEARQIHTSCLSSAPAYYTLLREEGILPKPADKAEALKTLLGIVAWLEGTYRLDRPPNPQTEIPVDANGLGAQSDVPADVPFS